MKRVQVRLIRKFAEMIDGIDLSLKVVGQTLKLNPADARLLVAEGWAVAVEKRESASVVGVVARRRCLTA